MKIKYKDETILPDEDDDVLLDSNVLWNVPFKRNTLISLLHRLYTIYLKEYKILIETNFPTLKSYFTLYSQMPVHYFVVMESDENNHPIKLFKCRGFETNKVTKCSEKDIDFSWDKFSLTYKNKIYEVINIDHLSIRSLLSPSRQFLDFQLPSEFTVLRSLIYGKVKRELPEVLNQLLQQYNVT